METVTVTAKEARARRGPRDLVARGLLILAAVFTVNDIALLPLGYSSPLGNTIGVAMSLAFAPGTVVAIACLIVAPFLRSRVRPVAIAIGVFLVLSFPLGIAVSVAVTRLSE